MKNLNGKQIQRAAKTAAVKWELVKSIMKLTKSYNQKTLMSKGRVTLTAILTELKKKDGKVN